MRIIDIGEDRYHVIKVIESQDEEFVSKLVEFYKERHNDFFLIREKAHAGVVDVEPRHLLCRHIDDAEWEEVPEKKEG